MAHRRKQIRQKFVELLTTPAIMVSDVIPLAVADVHFPAEQDRAIECFGNRARRINEKDLPVILIYTGKEKHVMNISDAPKIYLRELEVCVELCVNGDVGEDGVDDFATEVEKRILYVLDQVDQTFEFAFLDLPYVDEVELEETITGHLSDGESQKFGAVLTYMVTYRTEEPETVLVPGPFDGVDATVDGDGIGAIKEEIINYL